MPGFLCLSESVIGLIGAVIKAVSFILTRPGRFNWTEDFVDVANGFIREI